jgi:hypothetical protein
MSIIPIATNPDFDIDKFDHFTDIEAIVSDSISNTTVTVNPSLTEEDGQNYTTIQGALDYFRNKSVTNCVILISAGTYNERPVFGGFNTGGNPDNLIIRGDFQRDIVGYTFVTSAIAMNNRQGYLNTTFGTQGTPIALAGLAGAATLSITPTAGAVDLVTAGIVAGDQVLIRNDNSNFETLTILSVSFATPTTTLTFTTNLAQNVSIVGTAITFLPNVHIVGTNQEKTVSVFDSCTLDGLTINGNGTSSLTDGVNVYGGILEMNHDVIHNCDQAWLVYDGCVNRWDNTYPSKSVTISHCDTGFIGFTGSSRLETFAFIGGSSSLATSDAYLRLGNCIFVGPSLFARYSASIRVDQIYFQSCSTAIRATGGAIVDVTQGLFVDNTTTPVNTQDNAHVMLNGITVTTPLTNIFTASDDSIITVDGTPTGCGRDVALWNFNDQGKLNLSNIFTVVDLISTSAQVFTTFIRGKDIVCRYAGLNFGAITGAGAGGFDLVLLNLAAGINGVFVGASLDLVLTHDGGGGGVIFEIGVGTVQQNGTGALAGGQENIVNGVTGTFSSAGTPYQRNYRATEGTRVLTGNPIYLNLETAAGVGGDTYTVTGSLDLFWVLM